MARKNSLGFFIDTDLTFLGWLGGWVALSPMLVAAPVIGTSIKGPWEIFLFKNPFRLCSELEYL